MAYPMNDRILQLKQAIIKQKTIHLEEVDNNSPLANLYRLLHNFDEHVSKLVFQAFQKSGQFIPFPEIDDLNNEFEKLSVYTDPEQQRLFKHYRLYKQRLEEIYNLVKEVLTSAEG